MDLEKLLVKEMVGKKSKMDDYEPQFYQSPFHQSEKQYRWFIAANRTGKTLSGCIEALWFATGWHPYKDVKTPNKGWIVGLDFPALRDVVWPMLFDLLPEWMVKSWNSTDSILTLENGSVIGFKSGDSGWRKFQGADRDWIWFDEEPDERVYRECQIRISAGRKLQIWGTMTPLQGFSWSYKQIYKSAKPWIEVFTARTRDNKYLPPEEIDKLEDEYLEFEKDARLEGNYSILSGQAVFPRKKLQLFADIAEDPLWEGILERDAETKEVSTVKLTGEPNSIAIRDNFHVWCNPVASLYYVVGSDVAEGEDDASTAYVMDNRNNLVAIWWGRMDPDLFGRELWNIGMYYNSALMGVERNNHGHTTLARLRDLQYPNLYKFKRDKRKKDEHGRMFAHKTVYGWETTKKTKPEMIDKLYKDIRDMRIEIPDFHTIKELGEYIRDEDGEMSGQGLDDRVMGLAIANMLRKKLPSSGKRYGQAKSNKYASEFTGM